MKSVLQLASTLAAITLASAACDACIEGSCYQATFIKNSSEYYTFNIDRSTNTLYSFAWQNYALYSYNLDTGAEKFVITNKKMFSTSINQKTYEIYVKLKDKKGIYILNPMTREFTPHDLAVENVGEMYYFRNSIYYKDDSSKFGLHVYKNNQSDNIEALSMDRVLKFIVDKRDDIYFKSVDSSNVYKLKKDAALATLFKTGHYTLTTDISESAIFYDQITRAVYKLNYDNENLDLIGVFGKYKLPYIIGYDRDNNIVYCEYESFDVTRLYHFKRGTDRCRFSNVSLTTEIFVDTEAAPAT